MILTLFGFLIAVSLILIIIGLIKPTESAQALIGFFFLFLLSLIIIGGNLEYETGADINTTITYDGGGDIVTTQQNVDYQYAKFDDITSHRIGYYLAIASGVGFAGVLFSLAKTKWGSDDNE